jgi:hypothetical protein
MERQASIPGSSTQSRLVTILGDYRNVDGWLYPMRIQASSDGKAVIDLTILDLRFPKTIDDREFERP